MGLLAAIVWVSFSSLVFTRATEILGSVGGNSMGKFFLSLVLTRATEILGSVGGNSMGKFLISYL